MAWQSVKNKHIRNIISLISKNPMTPTMLSKQLKLHEVAISRYLKTLKDDELVKIKREQNNLYYSLNRDKWQKHVEETIRLAGETFSFNMKKLNSLHSSNRESKSNEI